jgi:hypothetical protein
MAQVDYNGVAQVAPNATPPEDYQHIQANPASFGGFAAQGEAKAGAGAEAATLFYGQVAADDQTNKFLQSSNDLLYGTGKTDPITGQVDGGVFGLKGADALRAIPEYKQKLQDLRDQFRTGLTTSASQLQFDTDTRRMQYYMEGELGRHGKQQQTAWANEVNKEGYSAALQSIALRPQDDTFAQDTIHKALEYKIQQLQVNGLAGDPNAMKNAMLDTARDVAEVRIKSLLPTDPIAAKKLLEDNRTIMQGAPNYDALSYTVKSHYDKKVGEDAAGAAMAGTAASLGTQSNGAIPVPNKPFSVQDISSAILKQESGNSDKVGNSSAGAVGPGQIMPATFAQYARPGENINNPTDNRTVSERIINDLSAKYNGDPERVAVGYFSGPGNVAPLGSPTPWLQDKTDSDGTATSTYVEQVAKKLGAPSSFQARADVIGRAMDMTKDNPDAQKWALSRINEQYRAAEVASMQDAAAKRDAADKATKGYMGQIIGAKTNPLPPDFLTKIAADPSLSANEVHLLQSMVTQESKNAYDREEANYGPGFHDAVNSLQLPVGDPNRITTSADILQRYGKDGLSSEGVSKVNSMLSMNFKSADDAAVNRTMAGFYNYAKGKLSFEQDTGPIKIRDPKGEQIFNSQFIPKFNQSFDEWVKQGKNPWDFLTQDKIDDLIKGMRPRDQMERERLTALGENDNSPVVPGKTQNIPTAPKEVVNSDEWKNAISLLPFKDKTNENMNRWSQALSYLISSPTPENIANFDNYFGKTGIRAEELIRKMTKPKTEQSLNEPWSEQIQ